MQGLCLGYEGTDRSLNLRGLQRLLVYFSLPPSQLFFFGSTCISYDSIPDSLDCIPDSVPDSVSYYVDLIKEKEAELRSAYAESINLGSDEFVSMILVDTAFTIEVLLRLWSSEFRNDHDRIFNKPYMINDIFPDMVLLENQLPLFIIKDLYQKVPPINSRKTRKKAIITTPSSVELCQAGVQFKVMKSTKLFKSCIHDDDFKSCIDYIDSLRVLKLTKLTVSRKTEVAVMNLLAFEQCNRIDMTAYANDFVAFLDCLIHSSKDVDLLVKQEIIDNRLADTSCAYTVIKKLGSAAAVSSESFCFASICEDLNQYHNSRRSRLKAALNKWAISLRKKLFLFSVGNYFCYCSFYSPRTHFHTGCLFYYVCVGLQMYD
ncbi:hypothetical protein FEM48_Zijuj04G0116000 [Ziziphus jujuba var. spinosa]|uniref:Uncharacterized protein n=1 Tax=Ziziphus jujuba var. spinosa TaxID=714518 RepID=A0A978VJN0_ZIZJJ|nr:hypothetical protein FEM48_Zijuj04G0116000 [Ziziphus jujuba var. spinosa]